MGCPYARRRNNDAPYPHKGGAQPERMAFCARLSSQRRAKRKTEKLVQELTVQAQKHPAQEGGENRAVS